MKGSFLVAATLTLVGSSAVAQLKPEVQTGSLIPVKPEIVAAERAGQIRKSFARCVYAKNARLAGALLMHSDPVTIDYAAVGITPKSIVTKFGMESCLGQEALNGDLGLKMQPQSVRSMLEEEAYLAAVKAPAEPATVKVERVYVSEGEPLMRARGLGEFADCVMAADASHADALLRTMPGSVQEGRAARLLGPSLGACVTQGQTIRFTPGTIRTFAADGAWQRVRPLPTDGTAAGR